MISTGLCHSSNQADSGDDIIRQTVSLLSPTDTHARLGALAQNYTIAPKSAVPPCLTIRTMALTILPTGSTMFMAS